MPKSVGEASCTDRRAARRRVLFFILLDYSNDAGTEAHGHTLLLTQTFVFKLHLLKTFIEWFEVLRIALW